MCVLSRHCGTLEPSKPWSIIREDVMEDAPSLTGQHTPSGESSVARPAETRRERRIERGRGREGETDKRERNVTGLLVFCRPRS